MSTQPPPAVPHGPFQIRGPHQQLKVQSEAALLQALRVNFPGQAVEITEVPSGRIVTIGANGRPVASKPKSDRVPAVPPPPPTPRPKGLTEDIQGILAAAGGMEVAPVSAVVISRPPSKGTSSQHGAITDSRPGLQPVTQSGRYGPVTQSGRYGPVTQSGRHQPVTQSGRQQAVDGRPGTRSGRITPPQSGRRPASAKSSNRMRAHRRPRSSPALPLIVGVIALVAVALIAAKSVSRPALAPQRPSQVHEAEPLPVPPAPPPVAAPQTSGPAPTVADAQILDPVVGQGLVSWYRFCDQARPGYDDSGNGHHSGMVSSGLTIVGDDQTGTALQLDGTGHMVIPSPVSTDFTIAEWLKTNQDGHDGTPYEADLAQWFWGLGIVDGDVGGLWDDFGLAILGGKLAFGVGARPEITVFGGQRIDSGTWHHIAVSRSNHGEIHLYVDGENDGVFNGPAGARSATKVLSIGTIASNPTRFLRARMADLRFYDRVLSATEVKSVMHARRK